MCSIFKCLKKGSKMPTKFAHKVAVLNRAKNLSDDAAGVITKALQIQVHRDFSQAWGIDATLHYVNKGQTDPKYWAGMYNLVFLDSADVANALGYHDMTPDGQPIGKVFVDTTQMYGGEVSVTASHELLEMLLDPDINLVAEDTRRSYFVAFEACDAVEADDLAYKVGDVLVSDFVLPDFFNPLAPSQGSFAHKYSFGGNIHRPFALAPGGYEAVYIPGKGWQQIVAKKDGPEPADRAPIGARRERRFVASAHGHARVLKRSDS